MYETASKGGILRLAFPGQWLSATTSPSTLNFSRLVVRGATKTKGQTYQHVRFPVSPRNLLEQMYGGLNKYLYYFGGSFFKYRLRGTKTLF